MSSDPGIEQVLAGHIAGLSLDDVGDAAVDALRCIVLDTCAVMVAGLASAECRKAARVFLSRPDAAGSVVLGEAQRFPASDAAFAHGVYSHWFDWDETHDGSHVHGAAVILPALLAVWNRRGRAVTAATFSAAIVAAFDVANRIGILFRSHGHRGWMPTGAGGVVAAAGAAARVMGLDRPGILSAMGHAASAAGISRQALLDRADGKNVLAGMAARRAVDSALLAEAGSQGAPRSLSGQYGLHALHAGGRGEPAELADDLGSRFSIAETSLKPYPSCRSTHAVIDAILGLRKKHPGLAVDSVRAAHIRVPAGAYERCGAPFSPGDNPRVSAQFSLAFTAALALSRGSLSPDDFAPAAVLQTHSELEPLLERISVEPEEHAIDGDAMVPVSVRVSLAGGDELVADIHELKGSPARPLVAAEQREKLRMAGGGRLLTPAQEDMIIDAASNVVEKGPDDLLEALGSLSIGR